MEINIKYFHVIYLTHVNALQYIVNSVNIKVVNVII